MRIDVVTIFPEYLSPLDLSLIGRARADGLIDLRTWNLRDFTHDRHRSVDDTPYGGGAGMVMRPEPWGEALDAVLASGVPSATSEATDLSAPAGSEQTEQTEPSGHAGQLRDAEQSGGSAPTTPLLIVPGPGGERFSQATARTLAAEPWLAFACGRYEGIDERVYQYAEQRLPGRVRVVSLGDYVLNGGEVAVLAIVEAVARLLPGVVGNAESLIEESHEKGLLEYPVYTTPASWRGYDVPTVLRSGDHAAIARWRAQEQLARTATRRPDLLPPSAAWHAADGVLPVPPRLAVPSDAAELLTLNRACWTDVARARGTTELAPLTETLEDIRTSLHEWRTWVVRDGGRLVGSVRARLVNPQTWQIDRLAVVPDLQGRGVGRALFGVAEDQAPPQVRVVRIEVAPGDERRRLVRRAGFRRTGQPSDSTRVRLEKRR